VWKNEARKKSYYGLTQQDDHSGMVLSVAWPLEPLLLAGLDVTNSAVLIQTEQYRWEIVGRADAMSIVPMSELEQCSGARRGAEMVDRSSYRVLSAMPSLPGVCVASFVPSAIVLKQDRLKSAMFRIVLVFVLVSLVLALLISLATTRAIRDLRDRMKRLKEGDGHSAVHQHHGPAEVRELSITFDRMVHSLRRSQAALQESEQKLSMAYQAARMWVWEHHVKTGKIEIINPSSKEPLRSKSLKGFLHDVHPADRRAVLAAVRVAMRSGVYRVEFRMLRDGEYLWASSWGQMVEGGEAFI